MWFCTGVCGLHLLILISLCSNFRADHNLQDVRSKIFPFKRKKISADEVAAPVLLPSKRKERSISSLVVDTPTVTPTGLTGRRTRAVTRKAAALRGLGPGIDDPVKKEIDNGEKHAQNSSLPTNLGKVPQTRRQVNRPHLMGYPSLMHFNESYIGLGCEIVILITKFSNYNS